MEEEEVIVLTGRETHREQSFKKPRSITITRGDYWSYNSKSFTVLNLNAGWKQNHQNRAAANDRFHYQLPCQLGVIHSFCRLWNVKKMVTKMYVWDHLCHRKQMNVQHCCFWSEQHQIQSERSWSAGNENRSQLLSTLLVDNIRFLFAHNITCAPL